MKLDLSKIKASDKIRTIEVLAKLHGWNAPEKHQAKGNVTLHATFTMEPEPERADKT